MAKKIRLIFLGPPGSGKGTYAQRISPKLRIPQIATGEIFRENIKRRTALGKLAATYVNKGKLVPDEVTIEMLKRRLAKKDTRKGFILDGFPRNLVQVAALEKITSISAVINMNVPLRVLVARLSARRQCKKCERIFNVKFLKPKKPGVCDVCGGPLFHREDDKPKAIKKRFQVYQKQTAPLIKYYRKKGILHNVSCRRVDIPPEIMVDRILTVLRRLRLI